MNNTFIPVAITMEHSELPYAYTMLVSLLEHADTPVEVYVITYDLTQEDCGFWEQLAASYAVAFHYISLPENIHAAANDSSQYRFFLHRLLPKELHRVLFLDTNLIVNRSLSTLYALELSSKKLAACCDSSGKPNSSVLLLDLDALRTSYAMNFSAELTQDIAALAPEQYNLSAAYAFTQCNLHYDELHSRECIINYSGEKPWNGDHLHYDIELLWWFYVKKTPFYPDLLQQTVTEIIMGTNVQAYASNIIHENRQLHAIAKQFELLLEKTSHTKPTT
jgi:lipopolysaccharide biosynthesis glycosyltransferase